MIVRNIHLFPVICFSALLVSILAGAKTFTLNVQAWVMWEYFGHDPLGALVSGHPHGLRYIAYYPVFALAEAVGISPDLAFGIACCVALTAMSLVTIRIIPALWDRQERQLEVGLITVALFAMSLLMNGRLIFAFCGYLLVILVGIEWLNDRRWGIGRVLTLTVALILASVSSGTLVVAMALAASIVAVTLLRDPSALLGQPQFPVSVVLILALFAVPTLIGINKNLEFYGGGNDAVLRMLDHGAGGDLIDLSSGTFSLSGGAILRAIQPILPYWWVGIIIISIIAWARGWRPVDMVRSAKPQKNIVQLAIALTLLGGLFAYSVLSMTIVPLLVLASGWTITR